MTDDDAGLNRCLICKSPSANQLCELCMEQNRGGGGGRGDSALAWWMTLRTMPYFALAGSALVLASFITVHAAGYRPVLETFLPGSWIATEAGDDGKPGSVVIAVGAVLALGVAGLTLLRRIGTQRWEADEASRSAFFAWGAGTTFLRTLVPAGTYDAASMRWLASDGLWYPPQLGAMS